MCIPFLGVAHVPKPKQPHILHILYGQLSTRATMTDACGYSTNDAEEEENQRQYIISIITVNNAVRYKQLVIAHYVDLVYLLEILNN